MARHTLTALGLKEELRKAQARAAELNTRVRIPDGDNLNLVVRANGGASWVLDYRIGGQRKPMTLGNWPDLTLGNARTRAQEARERVAMGVDLLEAKKVEKQLAELKAEEAEAEADTVLLLMDKWLRKHPGTPVYQGNIRAAFTKDVLPSIGSLPPHAVTRETCIKVLRSIEGRGSHNMVRRVRMWMRQMFEFGIDDEERPLLQAQPVPMGTLQSFAKHDSGNYAAITRATEVPQLMRAVRGYPGTVVRACLVFSAYVFQRPSEVREAVWEEFDLVRARWTIPENRVGRKGGGEHWVPLSTQVVEMLKRHQGVVGTKGHLFPGQKHNKPLSEGTIEAALHTLGFKGRHTPHGFRAMARTIGEEVLGIEARYLEKQLAHEYDPSGLKGAYNRAEYWDQRINTMQTWSDWLDAQA